MMVKRNTPARLRQKRGASARNEAKNKARNASPLPDKAPQLDKSVNVLQYYLLYASQN